MSNGRKITLLFFSMNRRMINLASWLLLAIAILYFGERSVVNFHDLATFRLSGVNIAIIFIFSLAYCLLLFPLALTWGWMLGSRNATTVTYAQMLSVYGRAQFAKYIPGNIFHYAGRQLLGRDFGWSQQSLALASIMETVVISLAAMVIILIYGVLIGENTFSLVPRSILFMVIICIIVIFWFVVRYVPQLPWLARWDGAKDIQTVVVGSRLSLVFAIYVSFLLLSGILVWGLHGALTENWDIGLLPEIGFAFVAAWFVGYLTPGASGGLGVREAALLLLLGAVIGEPAALILAIAARIMTTLGDAWNFLISVIIHRRLCIMRGPTGRSYRDT